MPAQPGRVCEFGIEAGDKSFGGTPKGYSVTDHNGARLVCPRNLTRDQLPLAKPSGKAVCPLHDQVECARAFFEQEYCPTRTGKAKNSRQF